MPDTMRYDNNGQPMGYGEPVDPALYGQPDPYGQYQQPNAYPGAMPSPQEIYAQQQYLDPNQGQPYMDPNQMYADQGQGMYGAQPVQADPYGQYPAQGGYMEPDMNAMPGAYPEMDPTMGAQPYMDPDQYMQQQMAGYGQPQQAYPAPAVQQPVQADPYGQPVPQAPQPQMPAAQPMPQQMPTAQPPMPQGAMPQQQMQPEPEPIMDKKAAKQAAREQKRAAKQQAAAAPSNLGPEPPAGKATLCMILGILSVVFALIPPIGIVLGFVVRKISGEYLAQGGTSPKAETGRIFATVGLIFSLIMLVVLIFMGVFIYAGLYGESQARSWSVFFNNSPFGNIWRIPIPNPLG